VVSLLVKQVLDILKSSDYTKLKQAFVHGGISLDSKSQCAPLQQLLSLQPNGTPQRTPQSSKAPAPRPQRTPPSPRRTPASNKKGLSGYSANRQTRQNLDQECSRQYGSGHQFIGDLGVNECSEDTARVQKDRTKAKASFEDASATGAQLRNQLKVVQKKYTYIASVMQVYVEEHHAHSDRVKKQAAALERYVKTAGQLSLSILQKVEICSAKEKIDKMQSGCFDASYMNKVAQLGQDALDVINRTLKVIEVSTRNFKLTAGQILKRLYRKAGAFVDSAVQALKSLMYYALRYYMWAAVLIAVGTCLPIWMQAFALNFNKLSKGAMLMCRIWQGVGMCIANPLAFSGMVSLILGMNIPWINALLDITIGKIAGVLRTPVDIFSSKLSEFKAHAVSNLMPIKMESADYKTLRQIELTEAHDKHRVNQGFTAALVLTGTSMIPMAQTALSYSAALLTKGCDTAQGLTDLTNAAFTNIWNLIKQLFGFSTITTYYERFLDIGVLREILVLISGDQDKLFEGIAQGIMDRHDKSGVIETTAWIFNADFSDIDFSKTLKADPSASTWREAIYMQFVNPKDVAGVDSLPTRPQDQKSLLADEKRIREAIIAKLRAVSASKKHNMIVFLSISVVLLSIALLIYVHLARKANTLEDFFEMMNDIADLRPDDVSTLSNNTETLRKKLAHLQVCLQEHGVNSCDLV
jgi:hypothetical protein